MDPYVTQGGVLKSATSKMKNYIFSINNFIPYFISARAYSSPLLSLLSLVIFLPGKGERRVVIASLTPASVHGVSQPRPASILLPTSQNTPMESAGTGMTGKITVLLRLSLFCFGVFKLGFFYLQ